MPKLIDTNEAARRLGVQPQAVRAMVRRGALPAWRVGGGKWSRYRFRWQDLRGKRRSKAGYPLGMLRKSPIQHAEKAIKEKHEKDMRDLAATKKILENSEKLGEK